MDNWLTTNIHFGQRRLVLLLTRRNAIDGEVSEAFKAIKECASAIHAEAYLRVLIEDARPELKDCCIYWMNYNGCMDAIEFGVEHPSLPVVEPYLECRRELLYQLPEQEYIGLGPGERYFEGVTP